MPPLATVGIISIGEMGMGIAKLLIAYGYRVVTSVEGRSEDTKARVRSASIEALPSDTALVQASDYILSIVPPRDATATAKRILMGYSCLDIPKNSVLYYLDLNAISPRSVRRIAKLFDTVETVQDPSINKGQILRFIDGGIIGSAPSLKHSNSTGKDSASTSDSTIIPSPASAAHSWNRPSIPTSGPFSVKDAPVSGSHLFHILNMRHISPEIGPASGLKCCFATTTKGLTALCIQSFTTAGNLGVLDELKMELSTRVPGIFKSGEGGVIGMAPKAYRWVAEMEEIAIAHAQDGGFEGASTGGKGIFDAVAEVYRSVAEDTLLGEEKTERRKRGKTIEDVAEVMGEGLRQKRRKQE